MPDKSIYLCSHRSGGSGGCDIWYCHYENGQYVTAENIAILNTTSNDCAPYVSHDQSFFVFNSTRSGGYGLADLYMSSRLEDKTWTAPRNLGPIINTSDSEFAFSLSPDEKYFFFTRRTNNNSDIYWVDAKAILPDPNGPIQNLSTNQRFSSIQCAVNYADSGDELVIGPGIYYENIDLTGKHLILKSSEPDNLSIAESTVIDSAGDLPVVTIESNTIQSELYGLTVRGGQVGIQCSGQGPLVSHCRIIQNKGDGIQMLLGSSATITNCIIADNGASGIQMEPSVGRNKILSKSTIINCTIVQNTDLGIVGGEPEISNSIVFYNGSEGTAQMAPVSALVTYSCIQGSWEGKGNIDADPLFADSENGDYHLKSQAGRWNPDSQTWVKDAITSLCIDAGNPDSDCTAEPLPNGERINMGAYGGTAEASKSYL